MKKRTFISSFLGLMTLAVAFAGSAFADDIDEETITENCEYEIFDEQYHFGEVVSVRRKLKVDEGEKFRVKVFVKNNGNMPWFSQKSECFGHVVSLGTDRTRDRASDLFVGELSGVKDTNWESSNRIGMDQLRVNPGEIASFTFWSEAGEDADVIKEYFTPVIEGVQWLEEAQFSFEMIVGDIEQTPLELRKQILYANGSGSVLAVPTEGDKVLLVDRGNQRVYAMIDDYVVREFVVSTGARATPTPLGETKITLKQEVRVGGQPPHYIMPKFMWFRAGGYGFHALPSLGRPNSGYFWTEAREHIGIPVSHGCVRLLPEDADFLFDFTEIGTTVRVVQNAPVEVAQWSQNVL